MRMPACGTELHAVSAPRTAKRSVTALDDGQQPCIVQRLAGCDAAWLLVVVTYYSRCSTGPVPPASECSYQHAWPGSEVHPVHRAVCSEQGAVCTTPLAAM